MFRVSWGFEPPHLTPKTASDTVIEDRQRPKLATNL